MIEDPGRSVGQYRGMPVEVDLDAPLEVARWRPLFHWLMAIPHIVVLYVMQSVLGVLVFLAFFAILFTGNIPRGMFDFMATVYRYQWRVTSYLLFMRESYPPFDFAAAAIDPETDEAHLTIERPEQLSRGLIWVKWLLVIPHFIALCFVGIGVFFAVFAAFFVVLFTGQWPEAMRDFVVGANRWYMRVYAYAGLMRDEYPPFSLE